MRFLEFREALKYFPIFSYPDMLKVDPSFDRRRLVEWQGKGYITKIRNGYYFFAEQEISENFLMLASNRIYKPSYLSFESALSYYNLIPEAVYLFTGVTTRKTQLFETPIGNFNYSRIKRELFFGYKILQISTFNIKIAEVEKAILDFFYINKIEDQRTMEGLRFNVLVAKELIDKDRLNSNLSVFNSQTLEKRINMFLNLIYA